MTRRWAATKSITCPRCRRNVLVTLSDRLFRHARAPRKGAPLCGASGMTHADALKLLLQEVGGA